MYPTLILNLCTDAETISVFLQDRPAQKHMRKENMSQKKLKYKNAASGEIIKKIKTRGKRERSCPVGGLRMKEASVKRTQRTNES